MDFGLTEGVDDGTLIFLVAKVSFWVQSKT